MDIYTARIFIEIVYIYTAYKYLNCMVVKLNTNDGGREWIVDIISKAMEKKLHLCGNPEIEEQTWELFKESVKERQLFLFGVGEGLNYFFRNCDSNIEIAGVVDNNLGIQGQNLELCCTEAWHTEYGKIVVESPSILNSYCKEDIVVLVTSTNFYSPMMSQIEKMGIKHCYILLMLEANKRKHMLTDVEEDTDEIRNQYIEWCCRQRIEEHKIIMLIGVYGSHARQITKALLKERTDLDIVWIVNNLYTEKPDGVRLVYIKNWKKYAYEMETAQIWVFDDIISSCIRKRKNQIYIQVKHWSSITLKKFYLDDKSSPVLTPEVQAAIKNDGARMDYLFSGSKFDEESCRSGFMFQGKNVRVGSPRSDILFDHSIKKTVLTKFGLQENVKICLYVPTFRIKQSQKDGSMSILLDMESVLKALRDKWNGEWFLFVRLHPSLVLGENVMPKSKYIINAGDYSDSEELVAASDVMITDYSSIMFEEAYIKKPVFLYAPDREEYIDGERYLLLDYDSLPFPIAESNKKLHEKIKEFDAKEYEDKLEHFFNKYGVCEDGCASERAARFIIELLDARRECI